MNTKYEPAWYPSPIDLPEASSGPVQIRHRIIPAGKQTPVVGMRQAFLRGIRPGDALLSHPLLVHELVHEEHGIWMTDLPEELNQIAELLFTVKPAGSVLVGGLGLGVLSTEVAWRIEVSDVTVIELDKHIIKLCANGADFDVVEADITDYLRTTSERFDFYLLDTWQGTSEGTWWSEVMPLRRLIRQRWGKRPVVHCWAEDIMQGQIFQALTTKPPHWYTAHLPVPMYEKEARSFLRNVGWPSWERKYGKAVDKASQEQE
ncbi:hypothetical protein LCGC14_1747980 [marine sediment metagenome]|uniref:PABS domain-containing protein n=1 Tax=marine sediment metagenome TaxID=412755 RepID=A0A0F9JJX1_9ZZZZ